MAHPHHVPVLDGFDRLTVIAYRAGLVLAAVGLLAVAVSLAFGGAARGPWLVTWTGATLGLGNLHLYDKRVRWTLQWLGWSGLLVRVIATSMTSAQAATPIALGTGLMLAGLSGLVLKEWFCFRIPLVRATPLVLAVGIVSAWLGSGRVAAGAFVLGALGIAAVAVAKLRMPLGHDVGDRSHYQI